MMQRTIIKSMVAGVGVLIVVQLLYVGVLISISHHDLLRYLLLGGPGVASFVAAFSAPRLKVAVGMSMAIYGSAIGLLSAIAYEYVGLHVDHIGGPFATFLILLVYNTLVGAVGSVAGFFVSRSTIERSHV